MKRISLLCLLFVTLLPSYPAEVNENKPIYPGNLSMSADSIVGRVMMFAPFYESLVTDYRADLYIKGRLYVRKKNQLLRYVPSMFKMKKGVREYLMESYSDLHYTSPNIYDQKLKASYGTMNNFQGLGNDMIDYFHVNIYSSSLLHSKLLSPLALTGKKYYTYRVDSVMNDKGMISYRISFTPKNMSYQLVKGYMIVSDDVWSVRELQFTGRSEYLRFDNQIKMGNVGADDEFLPTRYDFNVTFRFCGNVIDGNYTAMLDYRSIKLEEKRQRPKKTVKDYDLSESYTLQCDTAKYHTDSTYFNKIRPQQLTAGERQIYTDYGLRQDTTRKVMVTTKKQSQVFWGQVGDMLISNYTLDLARVGSIKCPPIINPFLVSYSGNDGFSYRQEFKYNRLFPGDRLLRIVPRVGYNFTRGELYWSVKTDFDYWPRKRAALHLNVGNGNRIYSSDVLDELKEMPDSLFDFNKIHLDYFRDFYIDFRHSLEITNGLSLDVGVSIHKRTAVEKSEFVPIDPDSEEVNETPGFSEKFRDTYVSVAPRVRVSWTPGQYYYMSGQRKVNLHSAFPTFSVDWERAVRGVFNSTGKYERLEVDMQHQISLGLMRTLYYRAGFGAFTNQEQLYFVDFVNFSKNNLPVGWNDDIGGVFQLLDRRWYNSSRKYVRANFTYEAPFLLLPRLLKYTRYVLNERLYLGILTVPHLNPYVEVGYGIGTHIFDVGVFANNINGKFGEIGFKFTFELFNR